MNANNFVFVGGGLPNLIAAKWLLSKGVAGQRIFIVEKALQVGGQFKSFHYPELGYFDLGMHIYYETCIPEIDQIFESILPQKDWLYLCENKKDIAGIYFNGKLQANTPYLDLTSLSEDTWKKAIGDLFYILKNSPRKTAPASAKDYFLQKFGPTITENYFSAILDKLYECSLEELDILAVKILALNRVALFDTNVVLDLIRSEQLRDRICYPDQLNMPKLRENSQRGLYPKKFGFSSVIDALQKQLTESGVKLLLGADIQSLEHNQENITSLTLATANKESVKISDIKALLWSVGAAGFLRFVGQDISNLSIARKPPIYYANLLFDKAPNSQGLYYFYCFDKPFRSYRVTDYSNYCPLVVEQLGGYPVCVEWWSQNNDASAPTVESALTELRALSVLPDNARLKFSKIESNPGFGFPLPSVKNVQNINLANQRVKDLHFKNVDMVGPMTSENVFFIKDVLMDTFSKMKRLCDEYT